MPGKRLNLDREQIKYEYAVGNLTTRQIADKYASSRSTVLKRCQSDHWEAARTEYKKEMYENAMKDAAKEAGNKLFALMEASDKLDLMIAKICDLLDNESLTVRELKDLTSTIKDAIVIKRDLWNLPKEDGQDTEIVVRFDGAEKYAG